MSFNTFNTWPNKNWKFSDFCWVEVQVTFLVIVFSVSPDQEQFSTWCSDIIWADSYPLAPPAKAHDFQLVYEFTLQSDFSQQVSQSYYVHLWDVPSTNVPLIVEWWPIPQVNASLTKANPRWSNFNSVRWHFPSNLKMKPYMGVSKNSGTPKWMVYNGKPY